MSRLPARFFGEGDPKIEHESEGVGTDMAVVLGGDKTEIWEAAVATQQKRTKWEKWEKWLESSSCGEVVRFLLLGS
jgi:hypothetical protein